MSDKFPIKQDLHILNKNFWTSSRMLFVITHEIIGFVFSYRRHESYAWNIMLLFKI